jgi:hypothetical protein
VQENSDRDKKYLRRHLIFFVEWAENIKKEKGQQVVVTLNPTDKHPKKIQSLVT